MSDNYKFEVGQVVELDPEGPAYATFLAWQGRKWRILERKVSLLADVEFKDRYLAKSFNTGTKMWLTEYDLRRFVE